MTDPKTIAAGQECNDRFYWKHGPCCAGCEHWRFGLFIGIGECRKAAPVSGRERGDLLGISGVSARIPGGHPLTFRAHHCGDFQDNFDWLSLPVGYLAKIMSQEDRNNLRARREKEHD